MLPDRWLHSSLAYGWHWANQSNRNRLIAIGLGMVAYYFCHWLVILIERSGGGSSGLVLMLGALGLGLVDLWQRRHLLRQLEAEPADRFLGLLLLLSGILLFPFFTATLWGQAILIALILLGSAISFWGVPFLTHFYRPVLLILVSLYPKPGETLSHLFAALKLSQGLSVLMAWGTSVGLSAIGVPTFNQGPFVYVDGTGFRGVQVASGCNGLNMTFAVAVTGLLLGIFMKQSGRRTLIAILIGIVLVPLVNVPRLMVLTLSSVYWGKQTFDFWHTWGGQIFTTLLLTVYYYLFMWLIGLQRASRRSA